MTKAILSPLTIPAAAYGGGLIGVGVGAGIYHVFNALGLVRDPQFGWTGLGYSIAGGVIGLTAAGIYIITDTSLSVARLINSQRMSKTIAEIHLFGDGPMTQKLYAQFVKKYPSTNLTLQEFIQFIQNSDANRTLCNGEINRLKPRGWFKKSLKYKIARISDLYHFIVQTYNDDILE